MAFCKNCGAELSLDQKFCANCGTSVERAPVEEEVVAPVEEETVAPVAVEAPVAEVPVADDEPKKAKLNVGMLVWSIIGLVVCCSPFSIPALIMTILAINIPEEEAEKKIKLARTFNIVSIVWGVIYLTASFLVGVVMGLLESFAFML